MLHFLMSDFQNPQNPLGQHLETLLLWFKMPAFVAIPQTRPEIVLMLRNDNDDNFVFMQRACRKTL